MKHFIHATVVALLALLACACSKSDNGGYPLGTKYLPVKLQGTNKWSIVDITTGKLVVMNAFKNPPSSVIDDMFFVMNDAGTYDYYNISNPTKPINGTHYGSVTYFSTDGYAIASVKGGPLTVIDKQGNAVKALSNEIAEATMFNHGRAVVRTDQNRCGYVTEQGDTAFSVDLDNAAAFLYDNVAIVTREMQDSAYDITGIDPDGNELFSLSSTEYGVISPYFCNGVMPLQKGDSVVCIDRSGKEVPNPDAVPDTIKNAHYQNGHLTNAGYYIVVNDGKVGMVDHNNQVMIPIKYKQVIDVSADRYIVAADSTYSLVDQNGKAVGGLKFEAFQMPNTDMSALRGFIDVDLVAANLMTMFNDTHVCGAQNGSTLMDLNNLVGSDPNAYMGINYAQQQMGALTISYFFDRDIASLGAGGLPQFNLDAKTSAVSMDYDLKQCANGIEDEMLRKISSALGTNGFVLGEGGIFTSEAGTAISMGYSDGIFKIAYFMNAADAQPLPRQARK